MASSITRTPISRAFVPVLLGFSLLFAAPLVAGAATFQNGSPANGTILVESMNYVTFSVDASATTGQTLAAIATISLDGGAPVNVGASYVITGYNWVYRLRAGEVVRGH